jgi:hypothetical protein
MTIPSNSAGIQPEPREAGRRPPPDDREAVASERGRGTRPPRWEADDEDEGPDARPQGPPRTSGKAIASVILGVLSLPFCLVAGIPGLILGIGGLSDIRNGRNRVKGRGLAVAGIVLGSAGIIWTIPALILLVVISVQRVRGAANRMASANNLKQIGLATINHADTNNGTIVPSVVYDKTGKPLYSWRVLILPYVEQPFLYDKFKLDEPWDSPNNLPLVKQMPRSFAYPQREQDERDGLTYYQVVDGPGAVFDSTLPAPGTLVAMQLSNARSGIVTVYRSPQVISYPTGIPDGASNTFLIVEARDPVPWTSPRDLSYGPNKPLPSFGLPSQDDFNALMADASIRRIPLKTKEATLRAFITRNGNEVIPANAP